MNENTQNITVPFHQSLIKPVLYAGAEREMTIMMVFSSIIIWIVGKDLVSLIMAGLLWFIGMFLARMAAFIDPQLTKIFIRHMRYQDYYPATEKLDAPIKRK